MEEKQINLGSIQKNSLLNALAEADKRGLNVEPILPERTLLCIKLLKEGKSYKEIGSSLGLTNQRVQQILTGSNKSALSIIRRHLIPQKQEKSQSPDKDEMIKFIESVEIDDLRAAIKRLNKASIRNLYTELLKSK